MILRTFAGGDEAAILDLANRLSAPAPAVPGFAVLSEAQVVALTTRRSRGIVALAGDTPAGYAGLIPAKLAGQWALEVIATDPAAVRELAEAAVGELSEAGATLLRWWVYGEAGSGLPLALGFRPERRLLQMARSLPAEGPVFGEEVEVRAFRPGVDDAEWLAVNNAAFSGHPENGGWTKEDLAGTMALAWFSPEGFRTAWIGGRLAGFCWTKVHDADNGEIYVIAVSPRFWGRGLGKELVEEGMRHLAAAGCSRVFLYADGDNARGLALYEDVGLQVERIHRSFIRNLTDS